jgi:dihydroxyacid dehydratase/phosphogluconate dehydratase
LLPHSNQNRRGKLDPERMSDEKRDKSMFLSGELTDEEFVELYYATNSNIGICRPYSVVGTMSNSTESLALAHTGTAPELSMEKTACAKRPGETAVQSARSNIRAHVGCSRLESAVRNHIAAGGTLKRVARTIEVADSAGAGMDYACIEWLSETESGPGMRKIHGISKVIAHIGAPGSDFLFIIDGRHFGASDGLITGYLALEAVESGTPLALARNTGEIVVNIWQNRLDLSVPGEILAGRPRRFYSPVPEVFSGFPHLARYRRLAGPADRGAIT